MSDVTAGLDVDAVVFDVGGVFVVPAPEVVATAIPEVAERPDRALVRAHYHGIAAYDAGDDAPERWPAYLRAYLGALAVDPTPAAIRAVGRLWLETPSNRLWTHRIDANVDTLARVAASGVRVGIISNADGNIEQVLRETAVAQVGDGEGVPVEFVVDSGVVGVTKPDPGIFGHALEALGLPPRRCAYVGDSFRNDVVGAANVGMVPVHLDPEGLGPAGDHLRVSRLADVIALLAA